MNNDQNKASGVTYVDRLTRQVKEVRGQSDHPVRTGARVNSHSFEFLHARISERLGNSSGALGHYLMDHVTGGGATGYLPEMKIRPDANEPQRPNGIYHSTIPEYTIEQKHSQFLRGYGYQGGGGAEFNFSAQGYGTTFQGRREGRRLLISMGRVWRVLARRDNHCEIDANLKDAWASLLCAFR